MEAGPKCQCKNKDASFVNGTCQLRTGPVVEMIDWKLNLHWNPKYQDSTSSEFKSKAAEIESSLFSSLYSRTGCTSVKVTSMRQGSILVTFNIFFANNKTVSTKTVENAMKQVVNDPDILLLNPDKAVKPQAQSK